MEARPAAQICLRGVTKIYPGAGDHPDVQALGPLDLDIAPGEFFSVVGPSGCGKSTMLDILSGLSQATSGIASFAGKPLVGRVPEGIGVVFQQDASFFWLNVWDNVAFGLRRRGVAAAEIERRVAAALSFMGLHGFAKAYPAQLSGGMRQRVCIARTLVLRQQPEKRDDIGLFYHLGSLGPLPPKHHVHWYGAARVIRQIDLCESEIARKLLVQAGVGIEAGRYRSCGAPPLV